MTGVANTHGDILVFVDADLVGLTSSHVESLVDPLFKDTELMRLWGSLTGADFERISHIYLFPLFRATGFKKVFPGRNRFLGYEIWSRDCSNKIRKSKRSQSPGSYDQ